MNASAPPELGGSLAERTARLLALRDAAVEIASPVSELGKHARTLLLEATGLSREGIEYALSECLEVKVTRAQLSQMARRAVSAPRAHVLLSANVFSAPFRAICLALCQSTRVSVRASTREGSLAALLHQASGHAFDLVDELTPSPGEHLWAYGSDDTLESLSRSLPAGVHLHAHGSGLGVIIAREPPHSPDSVLSRAADLIAQDTIAFDQRGCLSPRLILAEGRPEFAQRLSAHVAEALRGWEAAVPLGRLSQEEEAEIRRYRQTMLYVSAPLATGRGIVMLDPEPDRVVVPPIGRNLHVTQTQNAFDAFRALAPRVTTVGFFHGENLPGRLREAFGERRYVDVGQMQRPLFDGPVDLRSGFRSHVI